MSGHPKRCRERALKKSRYLANEANTPQSKKCFSIYRRPGFSAGRLSYKDTNTFLRALNEMEFEDGLEDGNELTETAA